MKKKAKLLFIPLFVLGFLAMVVILDGCKKATPAATCSDGIDDGCGNEWTACCNTVQCYYTYKGKKYNCDGTDCDDAAVKLADDLMSCSSIDLNSLTKGNTLNELIEVVKMVKESNEPCDEQI